MLIEFHERPNDSSTYEDQQRRTHIRRFWGRADSPSYRSHNVRFDPKVPRQGTPDPFDPEAVVINVFAERRERTKVIWEFTIISTNAIQLSPEEHPLRRPADIDWSGQDFIIRTPFDAKGKAILNTAKDLMLDEREATRWIASVSVALPVFPGRQLRRFQNVINSSSVTIDGENWPKETVQVKQIRIGRKVTELFAGSPVTYRPVAVQFHIWEEGYKKFLPNVGFNELTGNAELIPKRQQNARNFERDDDGNIVYEGPSTIKGVNVFGVVKRRIRDIDGNLVTEPVPLDRKGKAIAKPTPENVIKIEVDSYKTRSLSSLVGGLRAR